MCKADIREPKNAEYQSNRIFPVLFSDRSETVDLTTLLKALGSFTFTS